MHLTGREWWGLIHGMGFGAVFLLAFAGGLAGLYSLRPGLITPQGVAERVRRLKAGVVIMALAAWGAVLTGTWIVYPWYRAKTPDSPRSTLLGDPDTKGWHEFGMEWKEHVAWLSPILATAVAAIVVYYGAAMLRDRRLRRAVIVLYVLAFVLAGVAGAFGAFITKVAPVT